MVRLNVKTQRPKPQLMAPELNSPSHLRDLILHSCDLQVSQTGAELSLLLDANPVLPGVILKDDHHFVGMLSRRRFLEMMSRRYGPELFLRRPLQMLYEFAQAPMLVIPGNATIAQAVELSLQRSPESLYEPIIVQLGAENYQLLDVHHLLVIHAQIHETTMQLLHQQTQAKLFQTEKMASLGEMIAGVAHEILNPVNFIWGNLDYLTNYNQDLISVLHAYEAAFPMASPQIEELKESVEFDFLLQDLPQILSSMKLGAERLRKIIGALRSFSHMDDAVMRSLDIHECLDNTLLILNSRLKNVITVTKEYGDIPEVLSFSGQMSQVFTNLISNAIDALNDCAANNLKADWQPQILIRTGVMNPSKALGNAASSVMIQIEDNGPGIPPDAQAKVFDTFFTTKPVGKGTGLGLAISHQIVVEKHAGQLSFESVPGQGTVFTIQLPLAIVPTPACC